MDGKEIAFNKCYSLHDAWKLRREYLKVHPEKHIIVKYLNDDKNVVKVYTEEELNSDISL